MSTRWLLFQVMSNIPKSWDIYQPLVIVVKGYMLWLCFTEIIPLKVMTFEIYHGYIPPEGHLVIPPIWFLPFQISPSRPVGP